MIENRLLSRRYARLNGLETYVQLMNFCINIDVYTNKKVEHILSRRSKRIEDNRHASFMKSLRETGDYFVDDNN